MKRLTMFLVLSAFLAASVAGGQEDSSDHELDAKRLRSLLPKMLQSSDMKLVHEALLIVRSDLFRNRQPSDTLQAAVIATLQRLLKDPRDSEAGTRCVACQVLGRCKSRKALPVLLEALADRYIRWDLSAPEPGAAAEMNWHAVWRDADAALRAITGANPIGQPGGRGPASGQHEATRKAWEGWYRKNSDPSTKSDTKPFLP